MRDLLVNLHSLARVNTSLNWHKERMTWLKEGDANSKFFYNMQSNRRRQNTIHLVHVNGVRVG